MEKEVKLNGEKIKEAYEKAKDIDIVSLLKTFIQLLKVYGYFGKKIGILQTENKNAFEAITYLGSIAPDFMDSVAKKSPPEEFGVFCKGILRTDGSSSKNGYDNGVIWRRKDSHRRSNIGNYAHI